MSDSRNALVTWLPVCRLLGNDLPDIHCNRLRLFILGGLSSCRRRASIRSFQRILPFASAMSSAISGVSSEEGFTSSESRVNATRFLSHKALIIFSLAVGLTDLGAQYAAA